jgi:single-strand selective monofunctional uracil DNA glycosylase
VALLRPRLVVGVGAFAEGRARVALGGLDVAIGRIPHPSPASPAANRGWDEKADAELRALGVAP